MAIINTNHTKAFCCGFVQFSSLLPFGPATSLKTRLKPNTDFRNMATQPVCLFNKFGHCKFQKKCRKMHIIEVCGILDCEVRNCKLRHPKVYSFYRDYSYCKFSEFCSFSHNIGNHSNDALEKEIKDIQKELKLLKEKENEHEKT